MFDFVISDALFNLVSVWNSVVIVVEIFESQLFHYLIFDYGQN